MGDIARMQSFTTAFVLISMSLLLALAQVPANAAKKTCLILLSGIDSPHDSEPSAKASGFGLVARELRAFSSTGENLSSGVFSPAQLEELSAKNLERMLTQLKNREPITGSPQDIRSLQEEAELLSSQLHTQFVRAPMGQPSLPFYSALSKQGELTGFAAIVTDSPTAPPLRLRSGKLDLDAVRLSPAYAALNGYILPRLDSALELIFFFEQWDPAVLDTLVKNLKYQLPPLISDGHTLVNVLDPQMAETLFPDDKAFDQLKPLRERLRDYALTPQDHLRLTQRAFELLFVKRCLAKAPECEILRQFWFSIEGPQGAIQHYVWPFLRSRGGFILRTNRTPPQSQTETIVLKAPVSPSGI